MLPLPVYLLVYQEPAVLPDPVLNNHDQSIYTAVQAKSAEPVRAAGNSTLPETALPDVYEFAISIPAIQLSRDITPFVDPTNKSEYLHAMKTSVAHGKYTPLPYVSEGNTYLFAHSYDGYSDTTPDGGWFTRIDELEEGDLITLNFNGTFYHYTVTTSEVVDDSDTQVYSYRTLYPGHRSLTLQTCYPRGDTSQRLLVYATGE